MQNHRKKFLGKEKLQIKLTEGSSAKIKSWYLQVSEIHFVKIKPFDLLNWVLESLPEVLSEDQVSEISKKFFDPVKALKNTAERIRSLKKSGSPLDENAIKEFQKIQNHFVISEKMNSQNREKEEGK